MQTTIMENMMADSPRGTLPTALQDYLRTLDGALGDRLVGVILFGSHAHNAAAPDSDIDLAIVVSDADGERSRQEVFRVAAVVGLDRSLFSLSVETYLRIMEFLKLGDPFAWVVCGSGRILKDRDNLLADIQGDCKAQAHDLDAAAMTRYLKQKSHTHYQQAMRAFDQLLSSLQLSVMAGAQAVAANQRKGGISTCEVAPLADWQNLKAILQESGGTRREVDAVEQLAMAHKRARSDAGFAAKELWDTVRTAGELWARLLPRDGAAESRGAGQLEPVE